MSLGEFQLISQFFQSVGLENNSQLTRAQSNRDIDAHKEPFLSIGIGDDAAVISAIGRHQLAISVDTLVESVHFPENCDPWRLARRALRVNLSDMAAMGAEPRWFTLALTLPDISELWLEGFSHGLKQDAEHFGCQLIGGDTTKGPLNIGIQIMGILPEDKKALTRSGAIAGDLLVVTGNLGAAGAALGFDLNGPLPSEFSPKTETASHLKAINNIETSANEQAFLASYWLPQPRIEFAQSVSDYVHAACDISDGLLADSGHLCEQSHLSAVIDLEDIPISQLLFNHDSQAQRNALTAGDDYELCLAVPQDCLGKVREIAEVQSIKLSVVGQFQNSTGDNHRVDVRNQAGDMLDIKDSGYTHF